MKHAKEHARAAKVDKRKSNRDNSDAESSDDEDNNCTGVDDEDEIWKVTWYFIAARGIPSRLMIDFR